MPRRYEASLASRKLLRCDRPWEDAPVRRRHALPESRRGEPSATVAAVAPPAVADVLQLQRTHGNQAVARALLARQATADVLPPIADNLRRSRTGLPRLKALAARTPPAVATDGFVDIRPALEWLSEVVDTLTVVEPFADSSMLVFESTVVSGHDQEYATAEGEIRPALAAALATVIPAAHDIGVRIARTVMRQVNRSSAALEH